MNVGIIDYGMGNLASVSSALDQIGVSSQIVSSPSEISSVSRLILPGVGSFSNAMNNLDDLGWSSALRVVAKDQSKPILGICLGMQIMAAVGTEHGLRDGLGILPGRITHFSEVTTGRVPHVGWNEVLPQKENNPLLTGIKDSTDFYFVHSYYYDDLAENITLAKTPYGIDFSSIVGSGKLYGVQFHPEKSSTAGLALLKNFSEIS